ncbi:BglG family transcription antiterminator [Peribacillus loiseleuriae]|uniref:PTS sugar transporter n=1 Tax=Peribacillus loiseleuriae TaxID=1679170 RepID=A0A0K9GSQ0_9BACI|nr:BglG family transcription antiterminator [Peribacillus loiseleuriae]KMY49714.1 PTS sugar transporter [Peribacillus loiseleuriae]
MKAVANMIQNREKKIIHFILKEGNTRIKKIAEYMRISEKTVSNSLKTIDSFLNEYNMAVIRKPKVGVYIDGNSEDVYHVLRILDNTRIIPVEKEDRVIYIFLCLLKTGGYLTIQQLSDELFISRGTIEKDLQEVELLLKKEGVLLHKKPSKGIKLQISERKKRALMSIFIQNFWGNNWYLKQEGNRLFQSFDEIQIDVKGLFLEEGFKEIIDLVREFSELQDFHFTDYSFQSIVIHLAIAVERIRKGKYVEVEDTHRSNEIYRKVEEDTSILIQMLEKQLDIVIPKFEKGYINVHLAAAYNQLNDNLVKKPNNFSLNQHMDELSQFIEECLKTISYDLLLVEGLTTHMQSAINRLKLGMNIKNPFTEKIKRNFKRSFEQALYVKEKVEEQFNISIDDNETAYIALHFEAYYERLRGLPNEISAILVCSTGLGSSRLLAARINKYFPTIKIEKILSVQELMVEEVKADIVISTIHLELTSIPTIIVSPMMTQEDIQLLERRILINPKEQKKLGQSFVDLFDESNILLQLDVASMDEVITILGNHLIQNEYGKVGVVESALRREELSFTSFKDIATPHANSEFIKKSTILVSTLKKPIQWGKHKVDKVFFIALQEEHSLKLDEIYDGFFDYLESKKMMDLLKQAETPSDVTKSIEKGEL